MASWDPADVSATGVRVGDVLAGKYRVDRVLGEGGMGVVVAAHHMHLDDKVAIKLLLPDALKNPQIVARFDREARAAVRIKSEHVARVIDVGRLETGAPYMVMEYLEGGDLAGWLQKYGKMPVEQAVDFVLQACEAIAEAHALGIVHRDLKPANLFCIRRPDGALSIKVLDFGISKVGAGDVGGGMTKTTASLGSPQYMPPEQIESSKNVDARADIWALGVILYELINGICPFNGAAITELILQIVSRPPLPLNPLIKGSVPVGLERVIYKCLEKDRNLRYSNVAELAAALAEFAPASSRLSVERIRGVLQASGVAMNPPGPGGGTQAVGGMTGAAWGATGPGAPRSRAGLVVGLATAGVLVAGLAVGGVVMVKRHHGSAVAVATSSTAESPGAPVVTPAAPPAPAAPLADQAPSASASDEPGAAPSASSAPAATAATSSPRPSSVVATAAATGTTAHAAAPAPTTAKPAAKANCDPPWFVDKAGHHQYKKECL